MADTWTSWEVWDRPIDPLHVACDDQAGMQSHLPRGYRFGPI